MAKNLVQKIIEAHLVEGEPVQGKEIAIRIDQTLTQDATGTMSYLQFEAIGIPRVRTKRSVSYIDHNTLQTGFENADDHRFLQTIASKYGIYFSRPGNGICHQVHLERFSVPGETLLGSDSHTPTGGGAAMLAIGAGGLDVAVAMGGGPFYLTMPKVVGVKLTGKLQPWVSAKDIILEVLRIMTVKGGVGKVIEYFGPGVKSLTVPQRGTITNMGAELGATSSVFPSDEQTLKFFKAEGREKDWKELGPDPGATYDEVIEIDLNKLEPLIACPHMPDNVVKVKDVEGTPVQQVLVGSCTNSSYTDLMTLAAALKGKTVHPNVSMGVAPGSKNVFLMISRDGGLNDLVTSGVRILESACGPCIGMGQAPPTDGVSIRSFNRNFEGRSGTPSGKIYLASPEVCAAAAVYGVITDPRKLGTYPKVKMPAKFITDDTSVLAPAEDGSKVEVVRGPNIAPLPVNKPMAETISAPAVLKVGDNITTDHIMPAGAKVLPLRSNIPKIAEHVYEGVDPTFAKRAKEAGQSFIIGGSNYGQGSSREHAALAPMYLGVKAVIAKSFARIHRANLVNFGIMPLTFANEADYDKIQQGDQLEIANVRQVLETGSEMVLRNVTRGQQIPLKYEFTARQKQLLMAGGLLNYIRQSGAAAAAAMA
ncbi:MAG: aconitate hydratase [Terriglobales bacterium]